ncbi:MAG: hypothetical protein DRN83_01480 [Hadesarchaea archaeon]|nr:MAG: hypothetical protein DRN83_01480 [Hadesarchaea archaeon]
MFLNEVSYPFKKLPVFGYVGYAIEEVQKGGKMSKALLGVSVAPRRLEEVSMLDWRVHILSAFGVISSKVSHSATRSSIW